MTTWKQAAKAALRSRQGRAQGEYAGDDDCAAGLFLLC